MLSPLLIVAAVGLFAGAADALSGAGGALAFAVLVTARTDFLERAPLGDPYIQAAIPPIARPDDTMVVMTGDAPMGFIATQLPPKIAVLRIDGWMVRPARPDRDEPPDEGAAGPPISRRAAISF